MFTANNFNQNQTEYYGSNQSVSIEGISVDHFFKKHRIPDNSYSSNKNFNFSFTSYHSTQCGANTVSHAQKLLQWLCENTYIDTPDSNIREDTYSCV